MDVIIAQVCLHHKVSLFTLDEHFHSISGLKFFEPSGWPGLTVYGWAGENYP
jgi:hypothetical protein